MPIVSLAASDMRSLVQGGSKVSSSLTSGHAGHGAGSALDFGRQAACHRTVGRGQSHADRDLSGVVHVQAVDQAELVDVDRHLRIVDLLECRDDLVLQSHSVLTGSAASLPRADFKRVPRQGRALDARRIIAHAAEDHEFAEVLADGGIGGQQLVELVEHLERFVAGLPLRLSVISDADAVEMAQPEPTKLTSTDDIVLNLDEQLQLVAAERIVAIGLAVGVRHGVAVSRTLAVIENDFLIEVVDHQAKTSFTFWRPATSASISPKVL